jgi:N-acyl-D-aspartate/D-glutamate deacylase
VLDLVIDGGLVVDGTGGAPRQGDIGIADGRVVSVGEDVGPETGRKTRRIDATGLVVAPGFVDIHTHYDAQLSWDPTASPSPLHGVTTIVGGNCGFTLAPAGADHAEYLMRMMARVEGMPLAALDAGLAWDWTSFPDWLGRLEGAVAVNAGFLVGHSALRRVVMGEDAGEKEATDAQVAEMVRLAEEAMSAGALGFSSSRAPTHNDGDGCPVPSRAATDGELMALAAAVRSHPGTTLELILAGCLNGFSDDEVELMTTMSLAADRPLNWNVLGVSAANRDALEHQLEASSRAADRGATVVALTLPHQMSIRLSFLSGFVLDGLPGWRETLSLPVPERLRALGDPEVRSRLAAGAASPEAGVLRALSHWANLQIVETFAPENAEIEGRLVGEVAAERGQDPFDALLDVVIADGLRTGLSPVMTASSADWELRAEVWRDPRTVVGGSDAGAHLDMMCGAVYSTSLLGEAVRDRGVISIEEAVRQLSDVPARLYGLRDRGRLSPGSHADVVIFDPDRVGPGAVRTRYDLPGGAPRLYASAAGIEAVLVNGVEIVSGGETTGALPGSLLRSGQDTDTVSARPS